MLGAMGSTHCWTCTKMSSRTSFVGRGSQTGLSTLEVSYGKKNVCLSNQRMHISFQMQRGFHTLLMSLTKWILLLATQLLRYIHVHRCIE